METSPSESSCESWWSWWDDSDNIPDIHGLHWAAAAIDSHPYVPVQHLFAQELRQELEEDELRALYEAEDQAYDELIRECTEEVYQDQREGAVTPFRELEVLLSNPYRITNKRALSNP